MSPFACVLVCVRVEGLLVHVVVAFSLSLSPPSLHAAVVAATVAYGGRGNCARVSVCVQGLLKQVCVREGGGAASVETVKETLQPNTLTNKNISRYPTHPG